LILILVKIFLVRLILPFPSFFKSKIPIKKKKKKINFEMIILALKRNFKKWLKKSSILPPFSLVLMNWNNLLYLSIELDKIPNADGHFLRLLSITKCEEDYYTLEQWESCTEFETVTGGQSVSLNGLKYWILSQYRNVCRAYPTINCDALYMNENYIKNWKLIIIN